jgi:hypothetical protein
MSAHNPVQPPANFLQHGCTDGFLHWAELPQPLGSIHQRCQKLQQQDWHGQLLINTLN